jgi:hypothetical protein
MDVCRSCSGSNRVLQQYQCAAKAADRRGTNSGFFQVKGNVYYVSPTGNNSAKGTKKQPWKTIQHAAVTVTAGDRVMIAAGVYNERVAIKNSGTAERPISYIGEKGAVIDGLNAAGYNLFDTNGQSYINISGLKVQNALPEGSGISVGRSRHVRIENCHIANTAYSGIIVDFSAHVSVLKNEVEKGCQKGGEETISVKRSEYVEVNYNHIHHTKHEGIDVKEGSHHVNVIGNNIHDVERQGLYADAWDKPTYEIRFFNNVVHNCGFGIVVSGEMGGMLSDIWFCNNVVYNNRGPGIGIMPLGRKRRRRIECDAKRRTCDKEKPLFHQQHNRRQWQSRHIVERRSAF